jgi:hypothetical protein
MDHIKTVKDAVKFAIGFEKETLLYFLALRGVVRLDVPRWFGREPPATERRAVSRALERLERGGWIERVKRWSRGRPTCGFPSGRRVLQERATSGHQDSEDNPEDQEGGKDPHRLDQERPPNATDDGPRA